MSRGTSEDPYAALGRALAAIIEPIIREAVKEALAQHIPEQQPTERRQPERQTIERRQVRIATAAEMLDLHESTVRRLIRNGKLQATGSGRGRRVSMESIDSYARGEGRTSTARSSGTQTTTTGSPGRVHLVAKAPGRKK